ncbi:hypothetical protein [Nocardioides alcanivorans]|uniref:hypothetical protein n=1 Tax=Nocardioides alcanivorans TaxID=2897352 RepID=UPI001F4886ED|nr:hypothetical protein [Nocardioides alcanivorans]
MTPRFRGSAQPLARLLLGLLVACPLAIAGAVAAQAAPSTPSTPSSQTGDLCGGSVPCSVQADPTWLEGMPAEVAVTGTPDVTVGVRAFRVEPTAVGVKFTEFGPVVEVTTDGNGFGRADLELPVLEDDESGGPLLMALDDSVGPDLTVVLGTWITLASRRPVLLGDGYGTAKPVGVDLDLQVTAAVPGTGFDVEIERNGQWESAGAGSQSCADAATPCSIGYQVPRGLESRRHAARLVNTASGTPVATWQVLPSDEGSRPPGNRCPRCPASAPPSPERSPAPAWPCPGRVRRTWTPPTSPPTWRAPPPAARRDTLPPLSVGRPWASPVWQRSWHSSGWSAARRGAGRYAVAEVRLAVPAERFTALPWLLWAGVMGLVVTSTTNALLLAAVAVGCWVTAGSWQVRVPWSPASSYPCR